MTEFAETDPPYAPERENFAGFTHQEIWDRVHEVLDPAALAAAAAAWEANAEAVGAAFAAFAESAHRELGDRPGISVWRAVTEDFLRAGTATHDTCRALQHLMAGNARAARTLQTALVAPQPYRPLDDPAAEAVHGGRRRMEHDIAAAAATAEAQDTMATRYLPTLPASGDRVPAFPGRTTGTAGGSARR